MKPLLLAVGLFVAFLLARNTLTMSAQDILEKSRPGRLTETDTRSRRVASLEAQDQTLSLRQREVEIELEQIAESQHRVQGQIERESADGDAAASEVTLRELSAYRVQLLQKKAEFRQELERVLAERHRLQEDWQTLTGLRHPAR